ncbi:MAG: hypothetical protein LBQ76_09205 [Candidatus Fibromonas sp.]|nr:hypothetical protein [Candidatus Fibromonas sp.]
MIFGIAFLSVSGVRKPGSDKRARAQVCVLAFVVYEPIVGVVAILLELASTPPDTVAANIV